MGVQETFQDLQTRAYGEPVRAGEPHSDGLIMDFLSGVGSAPRAHFDGVRQMTGANVDLSYQENFTTAGKFGRFVGDAGLFLGVSVLAKKIPIIGGLAEGKIASITAGGLVGMTMPLQPGQDGMTRVWNTGLGLSTMGMLEFGPRLAGRLPGVSSLGEKTFAGSLTRVAIANGVTGAVNTEANSLISTGQNASLSDLALGTATWMAMGSAFHTAGFKLGEMQEAKAAARAWEADRPWQFKDVQNINAADLKPGETLAPGHYNISYDSQGATRNFNLYVSEGATQGQQAPLVTFLHGLNPKNGSQGIIRELEYNRLADQDGAVVAYLHARNGRRGPLTGDVQSWNDTNFGYTKQDPLYSDQVAFRDMMGLISQHVPTANTSNYAVSGFSLGGKMANRIAANTPEVSTLATLHGTMDKFDEQVMNAAMGRHPLDALIIHGTRDRVLPLNGGRSLFTALLENAGESTPRRQAPYWAESNNSGAPLATEAPAYYRTDFRSVEGSNRVTQLIEKDGPHAINGAPAKHNLLQWMMGIPLPATVFDSRQRSWDFMIDSIKRHMSTPQDTVISAGA